jgi:predicted phage terminase large subunit-like protein
MRKLTRKEFERKVSLILAKMREDATPFEDDSPEAKELRKERAQDYFEFCKMYLPHYFEDDWADFQAEILEWLEVRDKSLFAAAAPREHGKSVNFSLAYPIHQACYGRRHFIPFISATQELAADYLRFIQIEFEENPRIKQDFGNLVTPGWWETKDFVVNHNTRFLAFGRMQRMRGIRYKQYRPDLIIVDDLEDEVFVRNPKRVKETVKWLLGAVYGSLARDGTMVFIGNILSKKSVLGQIIHRLDELRKQYNLKSVNAKIYRAIKEDGTPLWPQRYSITELMKIKTIVGSVVFARDWQNDPQEEEGEIKEEWIHFYHPAMVGKHFPVIISIDPSVKKGETANYKAIITLGRDPETGHLDILDAFIKRCSIDAMLRVAFSRYKEFREFSPVLAFESNGFQVVLADNFEKMCNEQGFYPALELVEHRIPKEMRMQRLSPLIERGIIRFQKNQGDQNLLIEQLLGLHLPAVEDDGPDALEQAVSIIEKLSTEFTYKTAGRRRLGYRLQGY